MSKQARGYSGEVKLTFSLLKEIRGVFIDGVYCQQEGIR